MKIVKRSFHVKLCGQIVEGEAFPAECDDKSVTAGFEEVTYLSRTTGRLYLRKVAVQPTTLICHKPRLRPRGSASGLFFPRAFLGLLLALFVASSLGCMVGPSHSEAPLPPLSSKFAADDVGVPQTDFRVDQWWQFFQDPVLEQLLAQGVAQNLDLQTSLYRVAESRARFGVATGANLPDGQVLTGYGFSKRSPNVQPFVAGNGDPFDLFLLGFDSTWEIDLFGRISRSTEKAGAEVELEEADYENVKVTLLAEIASRYFEIRKLQEEIALTRLSMKIQEETRELVEARAEAGQVSELDVSQSLAWVNRVQGDLPHLEQQLTLEFNRLAVLLGQPPNHSLRTGLGQQGLPWIPQLDGVGIPADLVRRRPDIRREERKVAAASARIGIAESDLYPRLRLLGSISVAAQNVSGLFETDGLDFHVGPSLQWNILHFGRITQNVEVQQQRWNQAVSQYQISVLNAVREVEDALVSQHQLRNQAAIISQAIEHDKKAVDLSLQRYKLGKESFQRVLEAQQQLLEDQKTELDSRSRAVLASVRLFKALGGGCNFQVMPASFQAGVEMGYDSLMQTEGGYDLHRYAPPTRRKTLESDDTLRWIEDELPSPNIDEEKTDEKPYPLQDFQGSSSAGESEPEEIPVPRIW